MAVQVAQLLLLQQLEPMAHFGLLLVLPLMLALLELDTLLLTNLLFTVHQAVAVVVVVLM
jgi:hypothetical protein